MTTVEAANLTEALATAQWNVAMWAAGQPVDARTGAQLCAELGRAHVALIDAMTADRDLALRNTSLGGER